MRVPLPTPEGPVTTRTPPMRRLRPLAAQVGDQLVPLALGEPADRLAGRDPALREDAIHLHAAVLGDRQEQVEDLGRGQVLRGVQQEALDLHATRLQIALEPRPAGADLVRALERIHALCEGTLRGRSSVMLRRRLRGGRHAAAIVHTVSPRFGLADRNFTQPEVELEEGCGYLTVFVCFAGLFVLCETLMGPRRAKSPALSGK